MVKTSAIIVSLVVTGVLAAPCVLADTKTSTKTEWNGIKIRYDTTGGIIELEKTPDECHIQMRFAGDKTHSILITKDALRMASEALGIDDKKLELQGCTDISIVAEPDRLMLTFREQSSSSRTSHTVKSNGAGSTSTSTSKSRSVSSDVTSLVIAAWNNKRIELTLKGGNSVQSTVEQDGQHCRLQFTIDKGKNKRTISLTPGELKVDGKTRHTNDYSELFIAATRNSLDIKTDKKSIGSWKGNMGEKVLRD